jgi:hypothetical protein
MFDNLKREDVMSEIPKEKKPKKLPKLESTPVKFWHGEQEHEMDVVVQQKEGQNKAEALFESMKKIVGVKDSELASHIIEAGAGAIEPVVQKNDQLNIIAQTLHDFGPKNATEARLALQADALYLRMA